MARKAAGSVAKAPKGAKGGAGEAAPRRRGRPPGSKNAIKAPLRPDLDSGRGEAGAVRVDAAEANVVRARANLRAIGVGDWNPDLRRGERVGSSLLHLWKGLRRPPSVKEISLACGFSCERVEEILIELEGEDRVIVLDGPVYVPVVLKH